MQPLAPASPGIGKGGSPHISDPSSGSMLTTAIVGGGAPIANGLALAAKMRHKAKAGETYPVGTDIGEIG